MKKILFSLALAVICLTSTQLFSQTNFTGAISTIWNDSGNWDNGLPALGNDAAIPIGLTVEYTGSISIDFAIENNGLIINNGDFNTDAIGVINNFGSIDNNVNIVNDGILNNNGIISNYGIITNNGIIENNGNIGNCSSNYTGNLPNINPLGTCGCTDVLACNFDPMAIVNDGSCVLLIDCDDGDACTTDSCDPASGCLNTPIDCDDGDECTEDLCDNGLCVNYPFPTGSMNNCYNPIYITDGVIISSGINSSCTMPPGLASNSCFTGANLAIWYVYTATCVGIATVSSSIDLDEPDTRVSIHSDCIALDCIASDDDGGAGFTSIATFDVIPGEDYYIEWDDRWSDGEFDFEIICVFYDNGCTDPLACNYSDSSNNNDGSCIYATGCDTCSGETDGTGTIIDNPEVGEICDDNGLVGIVGPDCICACSCGPICSDPTACNYNDDPIAISDNTLCIYPAGCDTCTGDTDGSGTSVDNHEIGEACDDGDTTTINDSIGADCICAGILGSGPGTSCAEAIPVTDGITTSVGTAAIGGGGSSDSCFTGGTNAIWYSYTALVCDTVTISSSIDLDEPDTRVSVHTDCAILDCMASDDDGGAGFTSVTSFLAEAGTTYYIEWDDRWDDGEFDFEISTPSNTCPTDLNVDGITDGEDFSVFLGNFGLPCPILCPCETDFNFDGTTNGSDFSFFLGNFGLVCN